MMTRVHDESAEAVGLLLFCALGRLGVAEDDTAAVVVVVAARVGWLVVGEAELGLVCDYPFAQDGLGEAFREHAERHVSLLGEMFGGNYLDDQDASIRQNDGIN